jgi:hypothetical protein
MLLNTRHRGKQPQKVRQAVSDLPDAVQSAIGAESLAADGLLGLSETSRKFNVHFTHCRTNGTNDVQPHQLTRRQFWQHLVRCFRLAYPRTDTATGSILQFGMVCKELHNDSPREEDRSEHHHGCTHSSENFRWSKIRQISAERFNIQLNAVKHDTYTTMFSYLRCPTSKKPVHELDASPFLSRGHPQGEGLRELLRNGDRYKRVRLAKAIAAGKASSITSVRSNFGIVFNWVTEHNLRKRKGTKQLEADAVTELRAGRPQLLEFCKKHRNCLQDQLDYIWSLEGAEAKIQRLDKTRPELLEEAAALQLLPEQIPTKCSNGTGQCQECYQSVLRHHAIDSPYFRHELYETLSIGRRKGNALMIVGGRDTGKTTVSWGAIWGCV